MNYRNPTKKRGFTLLELIVTTAILAAITASSMVIIRTSYTAWSNHEADHKQRKTGLSVLKHIVRKVRQAKGVVDISAPTDNTGHLSIIDANGNKLVWEHSAVDRVQYGVGSTSNTLAENVKELTFVGIAADGITQTTNKGLMHSILCTTKVDLERPSGTETVTTSCRAWLRSW